MNNFTPDTVVDLNQVKAEFYAWRSQRPARQPIPPGLWHKAVQLLQHYSLSKVSSELRIDYQKLKRYQQSSLSQLSALPEQSSTTFLAVNLSDLSIQSAASPANPNNPNNRLPPSPSVSSSAPHLPPQLINSCHLSIERSDGSKLQLDMEFCQNTIALICRNFITG